MKGYVGKPQSKPIARIYTQIYSSWRDRQIHRSVKIDNCKRQFKQAITIRIYNSL